MDRGAWCTIVHGVAKSWTWLNARTHTHTHTHMNICDEYLSTTFSSSSSKVKWSPLDSPVNFVVLFSSFVGFFTLEKRSTLSSLLLSSFLIFMKVKVIQSSPTLLRPHGLYSPWNSPGQNTGVGSRSFLQGIFPTERSNPGLLHCWRILYQLSH